MKHKRILISIFIEDLRELGSMKKNKFQKHFIYNTINYSKVKQYWHLA